MPVGLYLVSALSTGISITVSIYGALVVPVYTVTLVISSKSGRGLITVFFSVLLLLPILSLGDLKVAQNSVVLR